MKRFNLKVFKEFWAIAKLYWFGNEKKGALSLLALLFILLVAYSQLSVILSQQQGEIISSLSSKDADRFWRTVQIFLVVLVVYVPLFAGFSYVQNKLGIYWRRWLTHHFVDRYFKGRGFYALGNFNTDIDNPDQRIAEDIKGFTQDSLLFLLVIVNSVLQVIFFSRELWRISPNLVFALVTYSILGTAIAIGFFGKKLVKIRFDQLRKEANFRFGLVRVRENSESIAFYQGEAQESRNLKQIFTTVFKNFNLLIIWQELYLGTFSNAYQFLPDLIPVLIVAPSVLSGDFEVGKVREAEIAFARVFFSLNLIISRFDSLTAFVAGVDRLDSFSKYLDANEQLAYTRDEARPIINRKHQDALAVEDLTLQTPNYSQTLIKELSFNLQTGESLLIMGASGGGKSSLLRAIAGLWNSGTGSITRPSLDKILFLPQKPYTILGNLRSQIIYPLTEANMSDQAIYQILEEVNLSDLAERFGGLDAERDWSDVLSLGEQQRLAFARILINKPEYIILDEATSALDVENEENLYRHLQQLETTFISVGHRPTLIQYHQKLLKLIDHDSWEIEDTQDPV
ncbi:ABC-type uncharacterized transport system, permease and ATPase component [Xenococcus sp. PCC 7305]|uniref:ABC transporter ATP-binding protein/permease n=1 Tax=Xenococcus sp. PCC 7305 TaxID=102125 RepID=UPI0002ACB329|nr:ABC transporter ATP-binding protein/permease [Xenococcus sp. PCC 7305]ELS04597.1 ABC-type uncharacterized transport system, permease and ATPase component [Xenococcus sp. PCC 7305]